MFSLPQANAAMQRERMFDACKTILQSASALEFLHEIIEPPSGTERLELSASARDGLACNLKILATTIYDSMENIPDTGSSFKSLFGTDGGENV